MVNDRGSGTVLAIAITFVCGLLGMVAITLGQLAAARAHAAGAADMVALAGASHSLDGDPCSFARQSAQRNGVRFEDCVVDGDDVRVHISLAAPSMVVRLAQAAGQPAPLIVAAARAGPSQR